MVCARMTQHIDLGLASALGATRPAQSTTDPLVVATAGILGVLNSVEVDRSRDQKSEKLRL